MSIDELVKVNNKVKYNDKICKDDVINSLKHLTVLGTGCCVVDEQFISTSPFPLSKDSVTLLGVFKNKGLANAGILWQTSQWTSERFEFVIVRLSEKNGARRNGLG